MEINQIFPVEEFPTWSTKLRLKAKQFWDKWIGMDTVGYDQAIIDLGALIDLALLQGQKQQALIDLVQRILRKEVKK